ncbi:uncharacterized protein STEHIDRAFT_106282 [Stereum hirsutum FP-91666 SS1]|uniref:Uncharacterized protein n=1 Tax=Stereum hirsutum (strain FP-91666) TaxID=721885 RepID=R7RVR7_STEHR|nr:uncharacterized protein STEHIDRAFT_106282 [Stereum hirsutum FP-91666 SS1]EIM79266.1 hypothetical protein STEHIDRAFT_106282 [Stereum hirsutum FP-91666 SS1]
MTIRITHFETHDVRFPRSLSGDGTDAMNTDCDCFAAYVTLYTSSSALIGHDITFTIGCGTDIVCSAIKEVAGRLVNKDIAHLFANMGQAWKHLTATLNCDGQLCFLWSAVPCEISVLTQRRDRYGGLSWTSPRYVSL